MKLVLDASMALAWLFERQDPKEAKCADKMLLALEDIETGKGYAKRWRNSI